MHTLIVTLRSKRHSPSTQLFTFTTARVEQCAHVECITIHCSQLMSCSTMMASCTISRTRSRHARASLPVPTQAAVAGTPLLTHMMTCMNNIDTSHVGCKHELGHLHHPFVTVTLITFTILYCTTINHIILYYIVILPCDVTYTLHYIIHYISACYALLHFNLSLLYHSFCY